MGRVLFRLSFITVLCLGKFFQAVKEIEMDTEAIPRLRQRKYNPENTVNTPLRPYIWLHPVPLARFPQNLNHKSGIRDDPGHVKGNQSPQVIDYLQLYCQLVLRNDQRGAGNIIVT